jgi:heme exporter protein B
MVGEESVVTCAPSAWRAIDGPVVADAIGLAKRFARTWALSASDLAVGAGERVFIVGENGSGKSTLLRLLAAASRPSWGAVSVSGYSTVDDADRVRRHVAFVPDRPALYAELTALEHLRFATVMYGLAPTDASLRATLDAVGLSHVAETRVRGFSRGMAQRLALATAEHRARTSNGVALVLLDEPYAALDARGTAWLDDWLDTLRDRDTAVVIATHQMTGRGAVGSRTLTLRAGVIVADHPAPTLAAPPLVARTTATPAVVVTTTELPVPPRAPSRDVGPGAPAGAGDEDWRRAGAVARKDLTTERRAAASLGAMAGFGALVLLLLGFALGPAAGAAAPGLFWVTVLLASLLALDRASQSEIESGGWQGLRQAPGARWPIYIGKVVATTVLLLLVEAALVPTAVVLYALPVPPPRIVLALAGTAALATVGVAAAGTVYAALIAQLRARQALLPLLLFPVLVPILLAAEQCTVLLTTGDPMRELSGWTQLLAAADVVSLTAGLLVFGAVLDE